MREPRKDMRPASFRTDDVLDANATDKERVSDHRPMAAPGNRFGAHEDTPLSVCHFRDLLNVLGELRGLHVICVAAKREIVPSGVGGIRARMAQATETRKMDIGNIGRLKR